MKPRAGTQDDLRAHPIRVLLVDDSERFRHGLRGLFELVDDIEVVAEAEDGRQGLAYAVDLLPNVVVMDLAMPRMDGFEATRLIRAAAPGIRVVVLTALPGQDEVSRRAGADAFLPKDAEPEALLRTVRSIS